MDIMSAKDGLVVGAADLTELDIVDGLEIQNEGAGVRTPGRVALYIVNTDDAVDLTATVGVTATLRESETNVPLVPEPIVIGPGDFALVGPFGREHEDADQKVNLTFTGEEGSYYAYYIR